MPEVGSVTFVAAVVVSVRLCAPERMREDPVGIVRVPAPPLIVRPL